MPRTFAYVRVSTVDQTPENQILEIQAAGFQVEPFRVVAETISGSIPTVRRPGFARLIDRMEPGDILIVTKLDRLGRNAIDVTATVAKLEAAGIKVHCLALGGVDLSSAAGQMTMNVLNAVAQFERDLLRERTKSGMSRARSQGKHVGRPSALKEKDECLVVEALENGKSVASIARDLKVSRRTITRIRVKMSEDKEANAKGRRLPNQAPPSQ